MMTKDRIEVLFEHYGLVYHDHFTCTNLLNQLDNAANLDTTGGKWLGRNAAHMFGVQPYINQVGTRVALHEAHLALSPHCSTPDIRVPGGCCANCLKPHDHHLNIMAQDGLFPNSAEEERAAIVKWLKEECLVPPEAREAVRRIAFTIQYGGHLK